MLCQPRCTADTFPGAATAWQPILYKSIRLRVHALKATYYHSHIPLGPYTPTLISFLTSQCNVLARIPFKRILHMLFSEIRPVIIHHIYIRINGLDRQES